jgi:hypothetical protein
MGEKTSAKGLTHQNQFLSAREIPNGHPETVQAPSRLTELLDIPFVVLTIH